MEVRFGTQRLAKLFSSDKRMRTKYGPECAEKMKQRLVELQHAAETLADMRHLPGAACYALAGDRRGQLAVSLKHPYRLIFEPDHSPMPRDSSGGLDWSRVTRILVLEIVDYH